ncbi:MAG: response regulator [Gammaproteobacteria bacterium]|nr:response regulator [Gammaproteobacteria bacterium]NIR82777.1 response regulator [Gammaproteobacteria bacterium]NIR89641.1 response regulator [Gammaproteobacteria bacterium]NIU03937.1 response regulator [Gammaproteobacteria bacterium]NIV74900.1 response regulator [Gammaproteobacteria bacterium]
MLVVEDENVYRAYLSRVLRARGYQVETAFDGRSALTVGSSFHPDVLIIDWMLRNEYEGGQVAEMMRDVTPDLCVIVITGFCSPYLKQRAGEAGISCIVEKPFELDQLISTVDTILGLRG